MRIEFKRKNYAAAHHDSACAFQSQYRNTSDELTTRHGVHLIIIKSLLQCSDHSFV